MKEREPSGSLFYFRGLMNFQIEVFNKLGSAEAESLVPQEVETILDKLINIERTAQFEQLNLSDEDCDKVIEAIDSIETKLKMNQDFIGRVEKMKPEYIPISLSDESFI